MNKLDPRELVEKSRVLAALSRDEMLPDLQAVCRNIISQGGKRSTVNRYSMDEQQHRMSLVMDCYLTGVAETLKMLHGDTEPEPWADDYKHETRLCELLTKYDLLK